MLGGERSRAPPSRRDAMNALLDAAGVTAVRQERRLSAAARRHLEGRGVFFGHDSGRDACYICNEKKSA